MRKLRRGGRLAIRPGSPLGKAVTRCQQPGTVYMPLSGVPPFPTPRSANSDFPNIHHDLHWKEQLRRRFHAPLTVIFRTKALRLRGVYTVICAFHTGGFQTIPAFHLTVPLPPPISASWKLQVFSLWDEGWESLQRLLDAQQGVNMFNPLPSHR